MLLDLLQADSMGPLTHGKILYNNGCHKEEDSHINFDRETASIWNKASASNKSEVYVFCILVCKQVSVCCTQACVHHTHQRERGGVINRPKDYSINKNLQRVLGQDADQNMALKPPLCMVGTVFQVYILFAFPFSFLLVLV